MKTRAPVCQDENNKTATQRGPLPALLYPLVEPSYWYLSCTFLNMPKQKKTKKIQWYEEGGTIYECARCQARKTDGRRCTRRTCKYADMCWQHTIRELGLKIGPSTLGKKTGFGLFTTIDRYNNKKVAVYGGVLMKNKDYQKTDSVYGIGFKDDLILNGSSTQSGLARYMNACSTQNRDNGKCRNNVHMPRSIPKTAYINEDGSQKTVGDDAELNIKTFDNRSRTGKVKRRKMIKAGEELFMSYGPGFWKGKTNTISIEPSPEPKKKKRKASKQTPNTRARRRRITQADQIAQPPPEPEEQPPPLPPPELQPFDLAELRQRRLKRNKATTWVGVWGENEPHVNTMDITNIYDHEGYGSMNQDKYRNIFYKGMINSIHKDRPVNVVDFGTGGSAYLSRMILSMLPNAHVNAFEVNPKQAEAARKVLKDNFPEDRWTVTNERITRKTKIPEQAHFVIHEMFGYFAGSEGVDSAMSFNHPDNPNYVGKGRKKRCLPDFAASFFYPVQLSYDTFKHQRLRIGERTLMTPKFKNSKTQLSANCQPFEFYDFHTRKQQIPKEATTNVMHGRLVDHVFNITQPGTIHGFATFVWLGSSNKLIPKNEKVRTHFPYMSNKETGLRELKITSSVSSYAGDPQRASNWQNVIVLLPKPINVTTGQKLSVSTGAVTTKDHPTYTFMVDKDNYTDITLDDLYPDWAPISKANVVQPK